MKLLYIVPKIKNAGGVARVLSVKANYFVEQCNYEVHVLSQNEEKGLPFYNFNSKVVFHNIVLNGNTFQFLKLYKNQINKTIQEVKPDVILVADNGLKAFVFPFVVKTKSPIVFEIHGSKFIEEKAQKTNFISKSIQKIKYSFKEFSVRKFTKIVALSEESRKEWNAKNAIIISNPSWIKTEKTSSLKKKKVICIARNSYEKGLDRLIVIWKKIIQKHSDWTLDIYTDEVDALQIIATDLKLNSNINIFGFVNNIEEKYLESSLYAMTSRSEGFPMVLLEAMASGLPCIAFDCPAGPRSLIKNEENGFLIPNHDFEKYVDKLSILIECEDIRIKLGKNAKQTAENFSVEKIMGQWKLFLESLIKA